MAYPTDDERRQIEEERRKEDARKFGADAAAHMAEKRRQAEDADYHRRQNLGRNGC